MELSHADFTLTLSSSTIRHNEKIRLTIKNLSDTPQTVQIYGRPQSDKLLFLPADQYLQLEPNAQSEVEIEVRLRKRYGLTFSQTAYPFAVVAANLNVKKEVHGHLLASPPSLFWPTLVMLLFAILFFLVFRTAYSFDRRIAANQQLLMELLEIQASQITAVSESSQAVLTAVATTPSIEATSTTGHLPTSSIISIIDATETPDPSLAGTPPSIEPFLTPTFSGSEDQPLPISLVEQLPFVEGGWTTRIVTPPTQGFLTAVGNHVFTYQPAEDLFGSVVFAFEACTVDQQCQVITANINLSPVNDAPVADDDALTFDEDDPVQEVTAELLAGDWDKEGTTLTITAVQSDDPERVIFSQSNGTVRYDPSAFNALSRGETASDSFQYTVQDEEGGSSTATVTVEIEGRNDAPVAQNDGVDSAPTAFTVAEDELSEGLTNALLDNDVDPDEKDQLLLEIEAVNNNAEGGTVSFSNGDWRYDPSGAYEALAVGETAVDSFTYIISDPAGILSNPATAQMTIVGVNDLPTLFIRSAATPLVFSPTISTTTHMPIVAAVEITDVDDEALTGVEIAIVGSQPDGVDEYIEIDFQDNEIRTTDGLITIQSPPFSIQTFETALQSAVYVNKKAQPTPGCRQVDFQVSDAAEGESNIATLFIQVGESSCPVSSETAVFQTRFSRSPSLILKEKVAW